MDTDEQSKYRWNYNIEQIILTNKIGILVLQLRRGIGMMNCPCFNRIIPYNILLYV